MSTHALIGLELPDSQVLSVYHHSDGYPEWLGVRLLAEYQTQEQVEALMNGGDLSNLDLSYWEMRAEYSPAELYKSKRKFRESGIASFYYLFTTEGKWKVSNGNDKWKDL
jgi:hypothetical protein